MMNARERRDLEEYRAYYQKVQKVIITLQQEKNKINLAECKEKGEIHLAAGAAAFAVYHHCLELLFAE